MDPKKPSLARRAIDAFLSTPPGTWFILEVAARVDPPMMRATGGRLNIGAFVGIPTLMLTTIGAKSGLKRTCVLAYFTQGEDIVIIASNGGQMRHPAWYHNLRANPEATVLRGKLSGTYKAREAAGAERERLWRKANEVYLGYDTYVERSGREIPVMVLAPVGR